MQIHQILPGFHYGDAISNEALTLRNLLRSWGHHAEIYCQTWQDKVAHECLPHAAYEGKVDDILIYHFSIGCPELTKLFLASPARRTMIYHNITPAEYFAPYNGYAYRACEAGRKELLLLRDAVDLSLGDSEYNCRELAENGFARPRVLPLSVDFSRFGDTAPCHDLLDRYDDDWTNFLFVGRISPNKRPDDVIRAFARYHQWIERRSRLFLVGSWGGFENYLEELQELVRSQGLEDHVIFASHVRFRELVAYYRLADVFLCMSEHEGFCVPLIEALYFNVPILAYSAAAVPDTLGESGILVSRKEFPVIAETAHLLATDQDLRERVLRRQEQRLADFRPEPIARQFRSYLQELANAV